MSKKLFLLIVPLLASVSLAGVLDRDPGIHVGERMTLEPYLAVSFTYDSNTDMQKNGREGSQWVVNPGLGLKYKDDNWLVDATVWYKYHKYNNYFNQLDSSSYGEKLKWTWSNASAGGRGWTVGFYESFEQIAQDDNMNRIGGRGMNRDRKQFQAEGVLSRRMTERLHAGINADYYLLDYDNATDKYAWLYGWKRLQTGLQGGYTLSKWTDLLFTANYQWYWQDNDIDMSDPETHSSRRGRIVRGDSKGWSVMTGIGTHATEKLSYRILGGWSNFEYGGGVSSLDGWTYQISADWQIDAANTWHIMALGSSYYQPSEREFGSALKVYNMSFGISKSLVRNKLRAAFDIAYRKETHEYTEYEIDNYDEDIWTVRFSLDYRINRLLSIYGRVEYQSEQASGSYRYAGLYDYDRWRATIGLRFTW